MAKITFEDRTKIIIDIRDMLQAALDERRTLKEVVREMTMMIAERRSKAFTE